MKVGCVVELDTDIMDRKGIIYLSREMNKEPRCLYRRRLRMRVREHCPLTVLAEHS